MAKPEQSKELTVPILLASDRGIGEMRKAVPAGLSPERLARVALTAWKNNDLLQRCTADSFMFAVMQAAQLGLEVNSPLGHASLIPYGKECKMIVEYKGLINLAHRSPNVHKIDGHVVRHIDEFDFEYGSGEFLRHKPKIDDMPESWIERDDMRAFWAGAKLEHGVYKFEVMSASEVWDHAQRYVPNLGPKSPWKTAPARMGIKTAIRRLLNQVPLSAEASDAISLADTMERGEPVNMGEAEIIPPSGPVEYLTEAQQKQLLAKAAEGDGAKLEQFLLEGGYKSVQDIPASRFDEAMGVCK